ncbi:hypothetical protein Vafri_20675, partial [Volvox africanus]
PSGALPTAANDRPVVLGPIIRAAAPGPSRGEPSRPRVGTPERSPRRPARREAQPPPPLLPPPPPPPPFACREKLRVLSSGRWGLCVVVVQTHTVEDGRLWWL